MKLSERLERWKIDWLTTPMNGLEERQFTDILRDLRALEGETRLPDAVQRASGSPSRRSGC